jgi:3-oxoacyl-[acyl-carrier-protein] synthase-3
LKQIKLHLIWHFQKKRNRKCIDPETIDYIIFAHNFGDVKAGTTQSDMLPSLATRVKNKL